jgi:acylphosphatase
MIKNKTVKFIFKGFIQGVGFRSFCHYHANKFDISGSVKNLSNGDVEVIASAPDSDLAIFFERIQFGPPGSHVEDIISEELSLTQLGKGFKIL